MKIKIELDELYPVFRHVEKETKFGIYKTIEMSKEDFEKYSKALAELEHWVDVIDDMEDLT